MKKSSLLNKSVMIALGLLAVGCVTTPQGTDKLQAFLVGSQAAETIEKTGDNSIDSLADSSTVLYKRVGGEMREYIEKTRGDIATIKVTQSIRDLDTTDEQGIKKAEDQHIHLAEIEKAKWTPEKLYNAAKEMRALDYYMNKKQFPEPTDLQKKEIAAGEKIYKAKFANENWQAKIAELEKYAKDLEKISQNTLVLSQDITAKITAKTNDIAALAQDPVMHAFVVETTALNAQKAFANDAKKKQIDEAIEQVAAKPEYKPIMDKKAQYTAELEKLKKDSDVLVNGIGAQVKYTGEAIPWLMSEYESNMQL